MTTATRIDNLGRIFGGSDILSKLLTIEQLNIIASFPGPIVTLSVGNLIDPGNHPDDLDLLTLDYLSNSKYSIFDSNYQYLFSGSTDRYLGGSALERQLASTAKHASFYYVSYINNNLQTELILLWLSRESSPETSSTIRQRLRDEAIKLAPSLSPKFSLFISLEKPSLIKDKLLTLLLLKGSWQSPPTLQSMFTNLETKRLNLFANEGRMLIEIKDYWLALVELDSSLPAPVISYSLKIASVTGTGTERLVSSNENLIFVAGNTFNRLSLAGDEGYSSSQLNAVVYYKL
jgi:hypothetical protein